MMQQADPNSVESVARKGRRVFGSPCKQSGDIGEDLGTDLDICVSKGDFVLVRL